jgi:DNA mismatch repair ATPase MutS
LRKDLLQILTSAEDISRVVQKFLSGKGSANDLSAVAGAIRTWSAIRERVEHERNMERVERGEAFAEEEWGSVDLLLARLVDLRELADTIGRALHGQQQPQQMETVLEEEEAVEDSYSSALLKEQEESIVLNANKQEWTINPRCVCQNNPFTGIDTPASASQSVSMNCIRRFKIF